MTRTTKEELPQCATCKREIEFLPFREVSVREKNHEKKLNFHYFFPCWDAHSFFQIHSFDKIISAGFTVEKETIKNPTVLRNLKNNLDLWI